MSKMNKREISEMLEIFTRKSYTLGYFKNSEKTDTAQHGDTKRRHHFSLSEDHFADGADHHETVETVEQRHEVTLEYKIKQ